MLMLGHKKFETTLKYYMDENRVQPKGKDTCARNIDTSFMGYIIRWTNTVKSYEEMFKDFVVISI
jgi:hypothetical protein